MEIYIVVVLIRKEKYYLIGLDGMVSKNIGDAILFPNKNVAYYYATRMENVYEESLGKVELLTFHELI